MSPKQPETAPARSFDPDSGGLLEEVDERYERRELVGRGGMGEVHLCFDRVVGREVAMKTMTREAREADK